MGQATNDSTNVFFFLLKQSFPIKSLQTQTTQRLLFWNKNMNE